MFISIPNKLGRWITSLSPFPRWELKESKNFFQRDITCQWQSDFRVTLLWRASSWSSHSYKSENPQETSMPFLFLFPWVGGWLTGSQKRGSWQLDAPPRKTILFVYGSSKDLRWLTVSVLCLPVSFDNIQLHQVSTISLFRISQPGGQHGPKLQGVLRWAGGGEGRASCAKHVLSWF